MCMCSHTELCRHARTQAAVHIHRKFSLSSSPSCHLPSPSPISLKIFPSPNLFSYSLSPLSFSHLPSLLPLFHRLSLSDLAICPVTLPSLAAGPSPSSVTCHHPLSSPLSLTFHLSHPHLTPSSLGLSQGERVMLVWRQG